MAPLPGFCAVGCHSDIRKAPVLHHAVEIAPLPVFLLQGHRLDATAASENGRLASRHHLSQSSTSPVGASSRSDRAATLSTQTWTEGTTSRPPENLVANACSATLTSSSPTSPAHRQLRSW